MAFFVLFIFNTLSAKAQNVLEKTIQATGIEMISIDGDQVFSIAISTSKTNKIKVKSTLDGEYQNDYQIVITQKDTTLKLRLEHLSFGDIPDDKRNAHKVIAAVLQMEVPENLSLTIKSDIGSVYLEGNFKSCYVALLEGQCDFVGAAETATINTLDGDINVITESAAIQAHSNHGKITVDDFSNQISIWKLKSINGNITVVKPD
ncbi:hypothetical protein [Winogradskyella sp. PC D3.3]